MNAATVQTDSRAVFAGALARMSEAHDALTRDVTEETVRRYSDACRDARVAFEALVLSGYEQAKARRAGL